MEGGLRQRLKPLPPAARAELIHVLRLPDLDRVERIGDFWADPRTRSFGELLLDLEEDKALKAEIWGLLREGERSLETGDAARRYEPNPREG